MVAKINDIARGTKLNHHISRLADPGGNGFRPGIAGPGQHRGSFRQAGFRRSFRRHRPCNGCGGQQLRHLVRAAEGLAALFVYPSVFQVIQGQKILRQIGVQNKISRQPATKIGGGRQEFICLFPDMRVVIFEPQYLRRNIRAAGGVAKYPFRLFPIRILGPLNLFFRPAVDAV